MESQQKLLKDLQEYHNKTQKVIIEEAEKKMVQSRGKVTTLTERGTNSTNSDAMVRFKNKDYQTALQTPTDGKL